MSANLPGNVWGYFCQQISLLSKCTARNGGYFCQQICSLPPNLMAYLLTFSKSGSINGEGCISASRFGDHEQICWQIYWVSAKLLVEMGGISAIRFPDWHQIYWQIYWIWANLPANMGKGYYCQPITWLPPNLLADFLTITKYSIRKGRYFCHQISWPSPNVSAEMGGTSAGRNPDCHQMSQQKGKGKEVFLLADLCIVTKIAGRCIDFPQIWQQKLGVFLLADFLNGGKSTANLLTVSKSASRNEGEFFASRFPDCHQIF